MKITYDTYLRYEELTQTLHSLADENPDLCNIEPIGKSYEGREIWLMELTNAETGTAVEKPAFWVVATPMPARLRDLWPPCT